VKENGFIPTFAPNMLGGMTGIPAGFIPGPVFVATPDGGIIASSNPSNTANDVDSLLQNHRRKMLRRAANRRSAQLSRARKKVKNKISLCYKMLYSVIHS